MGTLAASSTGVRASMENEIDALVRLFVAQVGTDLETYTTHNHLFVNGDGAIKVCPCCASPPRHIWPVGQVPQTLRHDRKEFGVVPVEFGQHDSPLRHDGVDRTRPIFIGDLPLHLL